MQCSSIRFGLLLAIASSWIILNLGEARAQSIVAEPTPAGTATVVTQTGDRFDITGGQLSSDGANLFHSFEQFGLTSGEVANFLSTPAIQTILGRVVSGDASVINGLLQVSGGNSNLVLINPAGIVFGADATLNVPAAFTATTANGVGFGSTWFNAIGSNDYNALVGMPDGFAFTTEQPGTVLNYGNLSVGPGQNLTLLGGIVISTGQLVAPGGNITVAAVPGENLVRISQTGSLLSLEVQPITPTASQPTPWTGAIASLPALLTGSGVVSASEIVLNEDGTVSLAGSGLRVNPTGGTTLVSGSLDASNSAIDQVGGSVQVLGDRVGLIAATINASGDAGGGTVFVGGEYQGQGFAASHTYISQDSTITVDSLFNGDGGRVIAWANDSHEFLGTISSRGTGIGRGGFVAIAAGDRLAFRGAVDLSSDDGVFGNLQLAAGDIRVVDNGTAVEDPVIGEGTILGDENSRIAFTLSEAVLEALIGDIRLEATNDIVVNDLADDRLGLSASSIAFRADADGNGLGNFSMNQGDRLAVNGNLEIGAASITTGSILVGDETFFFSGETPDFAATLTAESGNIQTATINTYGVDINLRASGNIETQSLTTGGLGVSGGSAVTLSALGNIQVSDIDAGAGGIDITAGVSFRAIASYPEGFDDVSNSALIEYLVSQGFAEDELSRENLFVPVEDENGNSFVSIPASLIARPNDDAIAGDQLNAPITIRYGGASRTIVDQTFSVNTDLFSGGTTSRLLIMGGEQAFVAGPADPLFVPASAENSLTDFDPVSNPFAFTLNQEITPFSFPSTEFPEGVSGTVGAILIGAGSNASLYSSLQNRPFVPPPVSPPAVTPEPVILPEPDPTPSTGQNPIDQIDPTPEMPSPISIDPGDGESNPISIPSPIPEPVDPNSALPPTSSGTSNSGGNTGNTNSGPGSNTGSSIGNTNSSSGSNTNSNSGGDTGNTNSSSGNTNSNSGTNTGNTNSSSGSNTNSNSGSNTSNVNSAPGGSSSSVNSNSGNNTSTNSGSNTGTSSSSEMSHSGGNASNANSNSNGNSNSSSSINTNSNSGGDATSNSDGNTSNVNSSSSSNTNNNSGGSTSSTNSNSGGDATSNSGGNTNNVNSNSSGDATSDGGGSVVDESSSQRNAPEGGQEEIDAQVENTICRPTHQASFGRQSAGTSSAGRTEASSSSCTKLQTEQDNLVIPAETDPEQEEERQEIPQMSNMTD